jgi:hypothetical protein
MSAIPFHVAGGSFTPGQLSRAETFPDLRRRQLPAEPAATATSSTAARATGTAPAAGSRRRILWEIPHKFHCPVIGVCFAVDELRGLMAKVMHFPRETTDFVLHTTAVGACEARSQLAELLHKNMEKRFALAVRHFAAAKDGDRLRALWREAAGAGTDIPGALWACWTHPAGDALLEQEIYGEIHMIQHQIGSGVRSDLTTRQRLSADNGELRRQLDAAQQALDTLRQEKAREAQQFARQLAELRGELASRDAIAASLTGQLATLRQTLPELKDRQTLARRANDAEARAIALGSRCSELEDAVHRQQALARQAGETIRHLRAAGDLPASPPAVPVDEPTSHLSGKCVLCVGGRSGSVDAYRQAVEQRGGRFLHHDGGLEESLHRIDAALSAADLVICQAGCISHNAYWRVKEQCKRSGKQCLFVKAAGVSSFERVVGLACLSTASNTEPHKQGELAEK